MAVRLVIYTHPVKHAVYLLLRQAMIDQVYEADRFERVEHSVRDCLLVRAINEGSKANDRNAVDIALVHLCHNG